MKNQLKLPAIFTVLLISLQTFAQQDAMVSRYMFNGMFLSPAYTGTRSAPHITAVYRKQWLQLNGAPKTALLSYDQKLKNEKVGIGLLIGNDEIGVTGQTDIYANYSYQIQLGSERRISFGLRGGISNYRADLSKIIIWDSDDEIFSGNIVGKWIPNFGAGAYYYERKFYGGFSAPSIIRYDPSVFLHAKIDRAPKYERHYYLTAGYYVTAGENITVKPSFLIKGVKDAPIQGDINLNTYYKNIVGIGVSYRTKQAIVGMVELNTKKRIRIGYASDYYLNELADYSNGTHEIMLGYTFEKGISVSSFGKNKITYGPEIFY